MVRNRRVAVKSFEGVSAGLVELDDCGQGIGGRAFCRRVMAQDDDRILTVSADGVRVRLVPVDGSTVAA